MAADRRRLALTLSCACHDPGSGLTGAQLDELESLLTTHLEALAAQARRVRELRRRLCTPPRACDAVRMMLDARLAATREEFATTVEAHRAIGAAGYGLCIQCHARIGFVALKQAPAATRCRTCAQTPIHPDEKS
jgi:RNA polymerase-binding transcription factor DksA